jgi:hypothetical protein
MKGVNFWRFTRYLFDAPSTAHFAAQVVKAILCARSPRYSDIARGLPGQADSAYRRLQRFVATTDPRQTLQRLFQADAPFVIGDPTEMPRPNAWQTGYVGRLQEHVPGFWLLLLATPFRGRAIPFHFLTYSSRTLATTASSRNQQHLQAFCDVKALLGERPLVLDREFSYEWLLTALMHERIHFVIRLKLGSQAPPILDRRGKRLDLCLEQGQTLRYYDVRYRGNLRVNLVGTWRPGLQEPLWVITDLTPERGLDLYQQRMKIDETFRDLKNLLHMDQLMNQQQVPMEKLVALTLLAFTIGYLVGEEFRDALFGPAVPPAPAPRTPPAEVNPKVNSYSGLFVFLKVKPHLSAARQQQIVAVAQAHFATLVRGDV